MLIAARAGLAAGDWIALSGALISGAALGGVIWSLRLLRLQADAARSATLATVHQNMADQMLQIDRYFAEHPELRPYFYGGASASPDDQEWERLQALSEMFADTMDSILLQCPTLEVDGILSDWSGYFAWIFQHSPVLQSFWAEHGKAWYGNSPLNELIANRVPPTAREPAAVELPNEARAPVAPRPTSTNEAPG